MSSTAAADDAYDPDQVLSVVLQEGIDRWLSIGLKMAFTTSQINDKTNDISLGADKFRVLFEAKAQEVGRYEAVKRLLTACRTIPYPIIGAVMNQLTGEQLICNGKL